MKRLSFLLSILIGGCCILASMSLQTLLSEKHSYWCVLCLLVITFGGMFCGKAIYVEYYKLRGRKGNNGGTSRFLFYKTLLGVLLGTFPICCIVSCDNYYGLNEE